MASRVIPQRFERSQDVPRRRDALGKHVVHKPQHAVVLDVLGSGKAMDISRTRPSRRAHPCRRLARKRRRRYETPGRVATTLRAWWWAFRHSLNMAGLVFGLHLSLCIIFGKPPILKNHSRAPFLCLRRITPPLLPQIALRSRGGVMAARIKKPVTICGHGLYWLRGSDLN